MNKILCGDAREVLASLPEKFVNCCVTSPPYFGLRNYGIDGQVGLEETPEQYVDRLVEIFREVRRVMRDDGTLWLNLGDSYNGSGKAGSNPEYHKKHTAFGKLEKPERFGQPTRLKNLKPKDLIGIPWMVAFALRADGWYLRSDIIWHKPNPMPSSVRDRCTTAHEYLFMLSKSKNYFYDADAIKEPASTKENRPHGVIREREYGYDSKQKAIRESLGMRSPTIKGVSEVPGNFRNKRSVWTINTKPYKGAHFATYPEKLVEPCIKAGCPLGGVVLDPFFGAGTTGLVARNLGRNYLGIELNPEYIKLAEGRLE